MSDTAQPNPQSSATPDDGGDSTRTSTAPADTTVAGADSGLDLSVTAPTTASPGTNVADAPQVSTDLMLVPPAAVPPVAPAKVSSMVPLDPAKAEALAARAQTFVESLTAMDPRQPEFAAKVRDISAMGNAEIRASSEVSNRMLERPVRALKAAKGQEGEPQKFVADSLVDLRQKIQDLDPSKINKPQKKLLGIIPYGDRLRDYFDDYRDSQGHLNAIVESLKNGQDELRKDNAAIEGEKVNLWQTMQKLQEYTVLAGAIDKALEAKADQVALEDPERADAIRSDMLFAVRQKHQDLLTQMAVSAQGYLALDMVRRNNGELIKGVERATTTTVAALRTAVIVAQALANQKLVLDQISALNETTSGLIVATSEMLKQQTTEIHNQAASTSVSLDSLKQAFNNIYATMDAIDTFKVQALDNMGQTVSALETELTRSKAYLERAHTRSENEATALKGLGTQPGQIER